MDFRILVVDDVAENLSFIVNILKDEYRVVTAKDGQAAIKAANAEPKPDLILLDVLMPSMDGFEVCKILKSSCATAEIPVIFLTVLDEACDMEIGFAIGGVDYVVKPFEPSVLKARVKTHCELSKKRKELAELNAKLELLVEKRTAELKELTENLQKKVEEETIKNLEKSRIMTAQSKLADMGEMISAIAHQWRQPLNAIGIMIQDVRMAYEYDELNIEYLRSFEKTAMSQVSFLSKTIDDFRHFFKIDKERVNFDAKELTQSAIDLVSAQFNANGVRFADVSSCGSCRLYGYPNELKQALLNLFSNARDAIKSKREDGKLKFDGLISVFLRNEKRGDRNYLDIEVRDNGGGVPQQIMNRVFEPYFSTKAQGEGVGIGLYMAKTVIENSFGGHISLANMGDGAVFCISVPL